MTNPYLCSFLLMLIILQAPLHCSVLLLAVPVSSKIKNKNVFFDRTITCIIYIILLAPSVKVKFCLLIQVNSSLPKNSVPGTLSWGVLLYFFLILIFFLKCLKKKCLCVCFSKTLCRTNGL